MQSHRIKVAVLERNARDILDVYYLFGFSSQPNNQPRYIGWRTVSFENYTLILQNRKAVKKSAPPSSTTSAINQLVNK